MATVEQHTSARRPTSRSGERLAIFGHDPDLLRGVPPDEAARLRAHVRVRTTVVDRGAWSADARRPLDGEPLGLLVLSGLLLRRAAVAGRHSAELLGPGDVVRPWRDDLDEYSELPVEVSWRVLETAELAVLDASFVRAAANFPTVTSELLDRAIGRTGSLVLRLAIVQHPRLTTRLLTLFWHLADRWGRHGAGGVVVPLRLSQETIAELISAQRPSVSVALKALAADGAVTRREDGAWLLAPRAEPFGCAG